MPAVLARRAGWSSHNSDGNIEDFSVPIFSVIYRLCVFTIDMKRERYNIRKYDESYKSHTVTDGVRDQN